MNCKYLIYYEIITFRTCRSLRHYAENQRITFEFCQYFIIIKCSSIFIVMIFIYVLFFSLLISVLFIYNCVLSVIKFILVILLNFHFKRYCLLYCFFEKYIFRKMKNVWIFVRNNFMMFIRCLFLHFSDINDTLVYTKTLKIIK